MKAKKARILPEVADITSFLIMIARMILSFNFIASSEFNKTSEANKGLKIKIAKKAQEGHKGHKGRVYTEFTDSDINV